MNRLTEAPVTRLIEMLDAGETTSREITSAFLDRIREVNPTLNAIISLRAEGALIEADQADQRRRRQTPRSKVDGIPFTVKDVISTADIPTTLGIPELADNQPDTDATVVRRLREAGAILLGKTNCPPWGGGLECQNDLFGATQNPWDLARTPGGSSGGEAAGIAARLSPWGLGSDSGGSLRVPAHFCGVATIKPTAGLVPITGMLDDEGAMGSLRDPRTQIGPIARTVDDVALLLSIIAGPDGIDAGVQPVPLRDMALATVDGCRVALQLENDVSDIDDDTRRVVLSAADMLRDAGAQVIERYLPDEGDELTRLIWTSYEGGMSAAALYQVLAEWDRYRSDMLGFLADFDLIVRPVYRTPAPLAGGTSPEHLWTVPFSLTGWPAAVVRGGWTGEPGKSLPIGVQLAAHPWRDDLALAAAKVIENAS